MGNPTLRFQKVDSYPMAGVENGDVIFCTGDHTIYVATGEQTKEAFYGGRIRDVSVKENGTHDNLVISYMDGTPDLTIDFSDVNNTLAKFEQRITALEGKAPVAGKDIDITGENNAIDVALDADISVLGVSVGTLSSGQKLTKGMSLSEILKKMLIRAIDAKIGSYPSITITANVKNGLLLEVNTTLSVTLSRSYTDGVFVGADSAYNYREVAGCHASTPKYLYNGNEVTNPHTLTVTEGSHQYKCTGAYSASTTIPKKNNGENSAVKIPAGTATSNAITIYGVYPIYVYGVQSNPSDTTAPTVDANKIPDAGNKLALVADGTQFGVAFPAMTTARGYRILLQKDKTIKKAMALNGLTGKYDLDVTSKFTKGTIALSRPCGDGTATYYVWEYTGNEGANRVIFTIG